MNLISIFKNFFVGIRKEIKTKNKDGVAETEREYQPGSLDGFQAMINRHLRLKGYQFDIMKTSFAKSVTIADTLYCSTKLKTCN